jgi:hypothetical protein
MKKHFQAKLLTEDLSKGLLIIENSSEQKCLSHPVEYTLAQSFYVAQQHSSVFIVSSSALKFFLFIRIHILCILCFKSVYTVLSFNLMEKQEHHRHEFLIEKLGKLSQQHIVIIHVSERCSSVMMDLKVCFVFLALCSSAKIMLLPDGTYKDGFYSGIIII